MSKIQKSVRLKKSTNEEGVVFHDFKVNKKKGKATLFYCPTERKLCVNHTDKTESKRKRWTDFSIPKGVSLKNISFEAFKKSAINSPFGDTKNHHSDFVHRVETACFHLYYKMLRLALQQKSHGLPI